MASKPSRLKDRRTINASVVSDKRGSAKERRRCPECGAALNSATRAVAGGSVITLSCSRCDYSKSSRQTDADTLMAKMTWGLVLEKKGASLQLEFPSELADALKAKAGDELILSPLTLPVGSLPMRWALTLKRKTAPKR